MAYKTLRRQLNELEIELQSTTDPTQLNLLKERIEDIQFTILKYGEEE